MSKHYEFIAYVDDWKGKISGAPLSPSAYFGRIIKRDDPGVDKLTALLAAHGAESWHATDRSGLFWSPAAAEFIGGVASLDSTLFIDMSPVADYRDDQFLAEWETLRETEPEVWKFWARKGNPYALSLYRYLSYVQGRVGELLVRGGGDSATLRVFVDTLDWVKAVGGSATLKALPMRTSVFGAARLVKLEAFVVAPDADDTLPHRRWLGLVDSEAWAFGRAFDAPHDGSSAWARLSAWSREGGSNPGLTPDQITELNAAPNLRPLHPYFEMLFAQPYHGYRLIAEMIDVGLVGGARFFS